MDITPVNGHILIKPLEHKSLLPTEKGQYDEIGEVVGFATELTISPLEIGDRVFYDGWLAAKYPTGESDEFFWLVPFKDVRAIQKHGTNTIPE